MFLKCSTKNGPSVPLNEIVLLKHSQNILDVLNCKGRIISIRATLKSARKIFAENNIPFFEVSKSILAVVNFMEGISVNNKLMLNAIIVSMIDKACRAEYSNIDVSQKRKSAWHKMKAGKTLLPPQNLYCSHSTESSIDIYIQYKPKEDFAEQVAKMLSQNLTGSSQNNIPFITKVSRSSQS
jgi:hypothetical protein